MLLTGWASREVAFDRPILLSGQFHARVSTHVNDPITVTALALESEKAGGGKEQAIMLSCDIVGVFPELLAEVRSAVEGRVPGFDLRKLIAHATHTHTGPTMREGHYTKPDGDVMTPTECRAVFVERAADAAVAAWKDRKPGGVSWAFGQAVVGHNRRASFRDGAAKMYADTNDEMFECIEGYEDHSLELLFVWDTEENLTGIVVNLACPSQVTEAALYVSADFWHEARAELRKRYGSELFILPQCAPAGDQSPHFLLYKKEEAYMRERKGVSEREEIAQRIARGVESVYEVAKCDIRTDMPFEHIVEDLNLPVRLITDEEYKQAKEAHKIQMQKESERDPATASTPTRRTQGIMKRYEAQKEKPWFTMELHVLRLGDVAIATNPFELFLDFGMRIKARNRALQTFLIQLACGTGSYLPTHRALLGKHYGAGPADSRVGPEGGQALVDRTVALINQLWAEDA